MVAEKIIAWQIQADTYFKTQVLIPLGTLLNALIAYLLCREGKQGIKSKAGAKSVAEKEKLLPLQMSVATSICN